MFLVTPFERSVMYLEKNALRHPENLIVVSYGVFMKSYIFFEFVRFFLSPEPSVATTFKREEFGGSCTASRFLLSNFMQYLLESKFVPNRHLEQLCFNRRGIPEFLDSGHKSWTLDSRRWTLDSGRWTLDSGPWKLHLESQALGTKHSEPSFWFFLFYGEYRF